MRQIIINRRLMLKMTSQAIGTSALLAIGMPTVVLALPGNRKDKFKALSQILTGFVDLDGVLLGSYIEEIELQFDNESVSLLLEQLQVILKTGDEEQIETRIEQDILSRPNFLAICQKLTTLWYTGSLTPSNDNVALRALAFRKSLQWRSAGVNAPGTPAGQTWHLPLH